MNQRGFGSIIYLIAAAVVVAAILGWGQYRYGQGVDKERTRNLNAALEQEVKMGELRRKHATELETMAGKLRKNSQAANQRIRELLQTNQALSDWWNTVIPPDAASYAWVLPASDNALRGGSDPTGSDSSPGEAGKTN